MTDPTPPTSRAALWLAGGLVDVEFYSALRGRVFPDGAAAAEDFVGHGMGHRLSSHPLLDFASLPPEVRRAWRRGSVRKVLAHLTDPVGDVRPVGPLADADHDVRGPLLELARRLGREGTGSPAVERGDWRAAATTPRRPGVLSVVVLGDEVRPTVRAVESVLQRASEVGAGVEVFVVDHGSAPHVALGLHARLCERPYVEIVRVPDQVARHDAVNVAVARSRGEHLLLLDAHAVVRRGALAAVVERLAEPGLAGVQPLLLARDDTIECAGLAVVTAGGPPVALLRGHPKEDARRLAEEPLAAISGDAMAVRTEDVVALEGLAASPSWDDSALDLCVRLVERRPAGFRLAPTALVTTWRDARPGLPTHPALRASPGLLARVGPASPADGLRWSLKLPSWPGRAGDLWGDTYFADALADALRERGQDVVTSRWGAHAAGPTHLDDVSLALRGLYPVPPTPGQLNVLWVISHPDDVDPRELEGYEVVCAASTPWSAELSERTGRTVVPLLQATGFQRPTTPQRDDEPGAVFVGGAGNRERPLVSAAVEAGIPLAVYGPGWEDLPGEVWCGDHVDNRRLPELYARHGIVLADHWPDMARHGFVANRVFDAVAAGARVISDDVLGVNDVFDPRDVRVARTPAEVAEAFEALRQVSADDDVPRPSLSFGDRADELLALVRPR